MARPRAAAALLALAALLAAATCPRAAAEEDASFRVTEAADEMPEPYAPPFTVHGLETDGDKQLASMMLRGFLAVAQEVNTGEPSDPIVDAAYLPQVRSCAGLPACAGCACSWAPPSASLGGAACARMRACGC